MPKFATLSLAFALVASANANVGSLQCFGDTASLGVGSTEFPGGIVGEAMSRFVQDCSVFAGGFFGQESITCDISAQFPVDYQSFVDGCATLGGQLNPTSWSICAEQLLADGDTSVTSFPDLEIVNFPACLAPETCVANTDIIATYKQFLSPFSDENRIYNDDLCNDVVTPAPTPAPTANSGGDPHFKTFNGKAFSYHGECDLVLMRSKSFDDGKGLSIHVRTTRTDNYRGAAYSYISAAAVQVGNTVLEVSGDDGSLLVNGSPQTFAINAAGDEGGADALSFAAGHSLKRSTMGKHGLITIFDLNLHNEKKVSIRCNTKSMMLFVDVTGYFEDSEGLLGSPVGESEGLWSRRNVSGHRFDMTSKWNSYGEEWQVLDTEANLFQEKRFPQYPQGCVYEPTSLKKTKRMLRRRLLLDSIDESALEINARKACAKFVGDDTTMSQFCINDVMATGDLELAEDPFYRASFAGAE